ncbi:MAG: 4'-phosphopantetheinyl transferase superfamily protein [Acidobacteria bacterium]|nr:4'-phosphopantetheinyl transferase superfamily protein [Acidobacteriota bacterium]
MSTARGVPPSLTGSLPRDISVAAHEIGPLEELIEEARQLGFSLPGALESAIDKRRREYLAGRISAAYALRQLLGADASEGEIGGDDDDVPRWPQGVVGSISHGAGFGFAAVAAADRYRGLGVDVERVVSARQAGRLGARVLTEREMSLRQGGAGGLTEAEMFTLVFSAKEGVYKALFPRYRLVLGFSDVELERRDGEEAGRYGRLRLRARLEPDVTDVAVPLMGWYAFSDRDADTSFANPPRVWTLVVAERDGQKHVP